MIRLSLPKKLSWALVVSVLFYLAAVVILATVFFPAKKESSELLSNLEQVLRMEQNLVRIVEGRSTLEKQEQELVAKIHDLTKQIPSQYDLPDVLGALNQLAVLYDLQVEDLAHVPLKQMPGMKNGSIPLTIELAGGQAIFTYLAQIQEAFPTLELQEAGFAYRGESGFQALIRANLHVLVVDQATNSMWEVVEFNQIRPSEEPLVGFGLPFEIVSKFLAKQVQVLGVVNAGNQSSALLTKDREKQWVKVGDRLDEAVVSSILSDGVMLDVDGVLIKLTIGG